MEKEMLKEVEGAVKNWWVSVLVGIVAVGFGIWCFATPLTTFLALTMFFICGFLITGICEIGFAMTNRDQPNWGWTLMIGILDIVFAILLLGNPTMAPAILAYFIVFWIMFQSFWGIAVSLDLAKYKNSGWGWLLAIAIMSLVLSIYMLIQPIIAGLLATYIISGMFVMYGIFRIVLGVQLRTINKTLDE